MIKCAKHPQRKRAGCAGCSGPEPTQQTEGLITHFPYPHVTEDGLSWLDPDGNTPVLDAAGRLAEPFVLESRYGYFEQMGTGVKLPDTPAAFRAYVAEIDAKRARTIKPKERN